MVKSIKSIVHIFLLFILGVAPIYFNYMFSSSIQTLIFGIFLLIFFIKSRVNPMDCVVLFLIFSLLIKFNYTVFSYIRINHILFLLLIIGQLKAIYYKKSLLKFYFKIIFDKFLILNIIFLICMFIASLLNSVNLWDSYRIFIIYIFSLIVYVFASYYLIDMKLEERRNIIITICKKVALVLSILGLTTFIFYKTLNIWDMYFNIIPTGKLLRLHFSEDPNYYASYILPGLVSYLLNINKISVYEKIEAIICMIAFLLTFSLGTLISFIAVLLIYFLSKAISGRKMVDLFKRNKIYTYIFVFFIVVMILLTPYLAKKFSGVIEQKKVSSSERLEVWKDSLTMNKKTKGSIFLGVGSDNAKYNTSLYKDKSYPRDMHNSYLQLYAETGIIGTVVFILIVYLVLKRANKNELYKKDKYIIYSMIFAYFFIGMFNVYSFWFVLQSFYGVYTKEGLIYEK